MVNYPYDAVSAATVRIEGITSSAQNRTVLNRIKNNDPSLTDLTILGANDVADFFHGVTIVLRQGDDLGWLGYFIGENKTLNTLRLSYLPQEQVEIFFMGLQRNKSIKEIHFEEDVVILLGAGQSAIDLPHTTTEIFLEGGDAEFEDAHHRFAVGLQRCKSLVKYVGPTTAEIVQSLTTLPMLKNVRLWRTSNEDVAIGREECVALRGLFAIATNLKHLHICFNLGNEGLTILAERLACNANLRELILANNIRDDGLRTLALGLSQNSHLKSLDLSGNSAITASGLRSLEEYLGSPSCALEYLSLNGINIGDKGARALADALRRNKSVKALYFSELGITKGWESFLELICDSSSPNSLYHSNHTLCSLGGGLLKKGITRWLTKNKVCQTPKLAAKTKILHFFPDLDMVPLLQWNLKLLPLLKSWFDVSSSNAAYTVRIHAASIRNNELSWTYKFVRGLPLLIVDDLRRNLARQVERTLAKKRRLMQG